MDKLNVCLAFLVLSFFSRVFMWFGLMFECGVGLRLTPYEFVSKFNSFVHSLSLSPSLHCHDGNLPLFTHLKFVSVWVKEVFTFSLAFFQSVLIILRI